MGGGILWAAVFGIMFFVEQGIIAKDPTMLTTFDEWFEKVYGFVLFIGIFGVSAVLLALWKVLAIFRLNIKAKRKKTFPVKKKK